MEVSKIISKAGQLASVAKPILVTGGAGRLGSRVVSHIGNSHAVQATSSTQRSGYMHLSLDDSVKSMQKKIRDYSMVIHSACLSKGTPDQIHEANVNGTKRIIQACRESDIPIMYISSAASKIKGLSSEATPYAHSKMEAENYAIENGVPVARVGVLVGDDKQATISLCNMAGMISRTLPSISIRAQDSHIQPIDYESAAACIRYMAEIMLQNKNYNEVIDIVGDPVSLNAFLDMINPSAIPLYVELDDLKELAELINDGAFTLEFIELAKKDGETIKNDKLKDVLGSGFKTVTEIASEARKEIGFTKTSGIARKILAGKCLSERRKIIEEVINLIRVSKRTGRLS
ncbi:NAD(P)-dependent oxidoreductase [uncultured Endozoicomonas sp.]|uniref:NAD-dependent epimerase/dehydratase family protein n=1 Tax=uncultured Endozoicomonas sp. TaxID=432652 RepID=UPI002624238C|nr:NAD(P)-dependent oxidoreductase [uncultured Endozoicomonas sp.]